MSKRTSRAFRATATVAGVAALGASFAGTAAADTGRELADGSSRSDSEGSSVSTDQMNGSTGESDSGFEQAGLLDFDMPSLQTDDSGSSDFFEFPGSSKSDDSDDSDDSDGSDDSNDPSENVQHPEQFEDNDEGVGNFEILGVPFGEDMNSSNPDNSSDFSDFGSMMDSFGGDSESGPLSGHQFKLA